MCGQWSSVNIKASSSIATGYISYAALLHNRLRNLLATLLLERGTPAITKTTTSAARLWPASSSADRLAPPIPRARQSHSRTA
jgi:hypothetical protein